LKSETKLKSKTPTERLTTV